MHNELLQAISRQADLIEKLIEQNKTEFRWIKSHLKLITKQDLKEMEERMAKTFAAWAAENGPKLKKIQDGIDRAQELIKKLQNSPGEFTPADQTTADELEKTINTIGTDADSVPTPPVEEPPVVIPPVVPAGSGTSTGQPASGPARLPR